MASRLVRLARDDDPGSIVSMLIPDPGIWALLRPAGRVGI
jgi:hypothetical protein